MKTYTLHFFLFLCQNSIFCQSKPTVLSFKRDTTLKTTLFSNIEIRAFYEVGKRNLQELDTDSHDLESYEIIPEKYLVNGYGLAGIYSINRLFFLAEGSLMNYSVEMESSYIKSYDHHDLPFGTMENNYKEHDYYKVNFNQFRFSGGFGVKLLNPKWKFNIAPTCKITKGLLVSKNVRSDYFTMYYIYNWIGSPNPSNNKKWDSISYPSRFSIKDKSLDVLIGFNLSSRITKNILLNIELYKGIYSTSVIVNQNFPFEDRLKYYGTLSIGYNIPLKDRPRTFYHLKQEHLKSHHLLKTNSLSSGDLNLLSFP